VAEPFTLPYTAGAIRQAAEFVRESWIMLAGGTRLSAREQAVYVRGLGTDRSIVHPDGGDWLAARVVNVGRAAARLEAGHARFHLPERINWGASRKARRNQQGRWYLRIPFPHARASLAPAVLRIAQRLRPGQYLTAGPTRGRARHAPGLTPYQPRFAANIRVLQRRAVAEGLRRVPKGRGRASTLLTFRTLTQDSPYWWIPPKPGAHLVPQVLRTTTPAITTMIQEGVTRDIQAILRHSLGGTP
jgi:hypothetical protein